MLTENNFLKFKAGLFFNSDKHLPCFLKLYQENLIFKFDIWLSICSFGHSQRNIKCVLNRYLPKKEKFLFVPIMVKKIQS